MLCRLMLGGLVLFANGSTAIGGDYSDSSGFSFRYPDDWSVVNRSVLGEAKRDLPPEIKSWVDRNQVNFDRIAVFVVRRGREEFLENVNVVVEPKEVPISKSSASEMKTVLQKQFTDAGLKIEQLQVRQDAVAGRDVLIADSQSRFPGLRMQLQQRQYMIPGGGKTFIVTCSARASSFAQCAPAFDSILASFQAPAATGKGSFNWNSVLQTALIGAVVGGVAGGLIALLKKVFRPKGIA